MLGNIQIEVLRRLQRSKIGIPIDELYGYWRYRDGAAKSLNRLVDLGHIEVLNGVAHFVSYPRGVEPGVEVAGYTTEQLKELEIVTRMNLVYTYFEELSTYKRNEGNRKNIPVGVKRTLQRLGVLKWKILELTDLGLALLSEVITLQIKGTESKT